MFAMLQEEAKGKKSYQSGVYALWGLVDARRPVGVAVSTTDSDSVDGGSSPSRAFFVASGGGNFAAKTEKFRGSQNIIFTSALSALAHTTHGTSEKNDRICSRSGDL